MRSVALAEVLYRSEQGRTMPYVCKCEDNATYFVKGKSAGRRGLASELVCAQLATELGLPVAEFAIAQVPSELIETAPGSSLDMGELGVGPAFGSQLVQAVELNLTLREQVSWDIRVGVAVFDWWVRNMDRALTEHGGNVNLLWRFEGGLVVIDHNLAFDPAFSDDDFIKNHIFANDFRDFLGDFALREAWRLTLEATLLSWDTICATIPNEWHYIDDEQTIPSNIPLTAMRAILDRCRLDTFWDINL